MTPLARRALRAVALLVPRWRRGEWMREWDAEFHADADRSGTARLSLERSAGAVADAVYLRSHAMYLDLWWGDIRFAWRNAMRRPGFTLLVALTLALGLGVNSAVFALLDGVLLRPLPYRDPSRLVFLWQTLPRLNVPEVEATPWDFDAWHSVRSLTELGMVQYGSFSLTGGSDEPERVRGLRVTASLMPTLGLAPVLGRAFTSAEDLDAAPPVVILSDGLWRRRYGADAFIVGRPIEIDGLPRTVVGVMPPRATLPGSLTADYDLWLAMRMTPAERVNENNHSYTMIGRLADGVTPAQASAELDAFGARVAAERRSHGGMGIRVVPIKEQTVRAIRPALVVAAVSVALLLLVATANGSTLLIARAANRQHELAVRAALGATRGRLLSLSIAECLVFAFLGALAGLALGGWTLRAMVPLFEASLPRSLSIEIDARAALFTAGLSVAIGVAFGALAAYRPGGRLAGPLAGAARSTAAASTSRRRNVLVVAQVALAVVLLSAAGLMLNSVARLSRVKPGFDADRVLTFRLALTGARYAAAPARAASVADLVDRLAGAAGVQSAGVVSVVPFGGTRNANAVQIEGRVWAEGEPPIIVDQRHVSPAYFQTMRIPLLSGRLLTPQDDARAERVIVINRTMAQRYFAGLDPINRRVKWTVGFDANVWFRIVGVVGDVRHIALNRDPVPEMYHPIAQTAVPAFTVVVRTAGDPAAAMPAARGAVRALDANLPIYEIRTMEERIAESFAQTRATMLLLLVTAALAAALAGVAVYGAIWYSVVQRTPEIGIRVALGASRASVFRGVISSALLLAAIGGALGAAGAMAGGSVLRSFLFETRTTDPLTYAAVFAGVLVMTVAASVVPAVRAMRVDPLVALRTT